MDSLSHIASLVLLVVGGLAILVALPGCFSRDRDIRRSRIVTFLAALLMTGLGWVFVQDDQDKAKAAQATVATELTAIRTEIASLDLDPKDRDYFRHRLDPQSGFLGSRTDVTLDDARAVLSEARAARDARKMRAMANPAKSTR